MKITYKLEALERKTLVKAITLQTGLKAKYLGVPSLAYQIGDWHIDKASTLTGPDDHDLIAALRDQHSFVPESEEYDAPVEEAEAPAEEAPQAEAAPAEQEGDCVCIEIPLANFDPPALERLAAMVTAKEALIKKALNVDSLPIQVLEDRIAFPWFTSIDGAEVNAYAQFITALARTAREKKRVTAKAPADGFENEAFAMRVFLIGLGLIGPEYKLVRALMGRNLGGNSAWRFGPHEKAPAPQEEAVVDTAALAAAAAEVIEAAGGEVIAVTAAEGEEAEIVD